MIKEIVVSYLTCKYREKGSHVEDNWGQGVITFWKWKELSWCRCKGKTEGEAAQPREAKAQRNGAWSGEPESAAKEEGNQREVRRTFKMLREVWLNVRVEKLFTHEDVTVKALLDSSATGMFMDKRMAARHRFKLQKLERPIMVRNIDRTNNSGGAITHQIEVNVYYKSHVGRIRMDVCDLGKTEIILGMPWLAAHNLEINWKTEEVKMTRCPPLCEGVKIREKERKKRGRRVATLEEEKIVRWAIDNKEGWGREEEIKEDHRKIEEMVPKKFLKWKKVFGKVESERMPMRKVWDHAIDLKERSNHDREGSILYPKMRGKKSRVLWKTN